MEISPVAESNCRAFMKLDNYVDQGLVLQLMEAAVEYLNGAGIPAPANLDEAPALYSLALNSLTLHYYDHRDATEAAVPIPLGLRLIINQLKQSSDGFF